MYFNVVVICHHIFNNFNKVKRGGIFLITENLSTLKIHVLTQAQYDRELDTGNINRNEIYLTPYEEINPTTIRLPQDDISEVNLSTTAQSGEIVVGRAATKGVMNNTSASSYLSPNTNAVPTCATLYNFVQISYETIEATIPTGQMFYNVDLTTPATKNEILVPVGLLAGNSFVTVHKNSESSNNVDSITFHRSDTDTSKDRPSICYLMRLKVMKY